MEYLESADWILINYLMHCMTSISGTAGEGDGWSHGSRV